MPLLTEGHAAVDTTRQVSEGRADAGSEAEFRCVEGRIFGLEAEFRSFGGRISALEAEFRCVVAEMDPLSSEHGTYETVTVTFWPWFSSHSPSNVSFCLLFALTQGHATEFFSVVKGTPPFFFQFFTFCPHTGARRRRYAAVGLRGKNRAEATWF